MSNLTSAQLQKLMAYVDGELDTASRLEVDVLLASNVEAVRFVEQIADLGTLVKVGYAEKTAKTVASFDVSGAVMASVASAGGATVSSLADARARAAAAAGRSPSTSARLKIGAGIAAALALAASVFVFARNSAQEMPMASWRSDVAAQPTASAASAVVASSGNGTGVEVRTVESAGNSVSVLYLPSANELSTSVVVWVDESGEK